MQTKSQLYKKLIIGAFLIVPILSSFISTVHVVTLFQLGNVVWMSIFLAVVFELGQLSSLLALAVLDKINKFLVWSIFILLAFMQILGNIYYTFDFIGLKLLENPEWLSSALELVNRFTYEDVNVNDAKFYVSLIIGIPIPLIAVAFLKSLVDYLKAGEEPSVVQPVSQQPVTQNEIETETKNEAPQVIKQKEVVKEKVLEESSVVNKENAVNNDTDLDTDLDKIAKKFNDKKYIDNLWVDVKSDEKEVDLGVVKGKTKKK
jgi:hypothetical protein